MTATKLSQSENKAVHKIPLRKNVVEALYGIISKFLSTYVAKTSFTPNQITIISGMFGIIGAFLLTSQNKTGLISAGVFIQLFVILDLVDGDIARMKNMQSLFGKWLDRFFDKLNDFLLIIAFAVGLFLRTNRISALYLGITLMGLVFSIQNSMLANKVFFDDINKKSNESAYCDKEKVAKNLNYFSLKAINRFIGKHLLLEHCTFLFLLSLFTFFNRIGLGLVVLTIHAALTMIFIVLSNLYQFRKYYSQKGNQ